MTIRTRIAPSPTGQLHIGSLATALRNYAYARGREGQFVIRIEDTDRERLVPGAIEATLKVLKDYGLSWDEGPDKDGPYGPYIQSQRLSIYKEHVQKLIDSGHAYYCFCTKDRLDQMRLEQQQAKKLPKYDRTCLQLTPEQIKAKLAANTSHVIRLKIPADQTITFTDQIRGQISFPSNDLDDQVLLKSDGYPTYHLGVVVDDHLMKITHIIRGEEWISSTPKHILLYQAFNWPIPIYAHLPVFLSPTGKGKMSKRHGDVSAQAFLDKGYLPKAILNFLMIMGWAPKDKNEVISLDQFIMQFDIQDVSSKSTIFDLNKLNWLNGIYTRNMTDDELLVRLKPYIPKDITDDMLAQIIPLIKDRLEKLSDLSDLTSYFVTPAEISVPDLLKESKLSPSETAHYLSQVHHVMSELSDWSVASLETALHQLQAKLSLKPRPAFMTIRLAITGRSATPPLFDTLSVIGQPQCLSRLANAQQLLEK